jgi:uncharacterized membrane protein YdbT with pleckstrin-like domain
MINLSRILNQAENERTIFFLRRHWFTISPVLMGFIVALLLPIGAYALISYRAPEFLADPARFTLFVLGASMFFLYAWLFLFMNFLDWFLDIWIVTDHRIVNIEQSGLFGRTMSELMLYNVQDVTSEVKGFLHTVFNYGIIEIQTAGEKDRFIFENVPHPDHLAKRILELAGQQRSAAPNNQTI